MNIEKIFEGEGGYVFVSHSHLDLKEVREVRNFLELCGMEPILFYLRSMENSNEGRMELLRKLIYEEIDAREFFLYLESDNSKNSQWVQEEIRYVTENAPDKLMVVPLSQGADGIKKQLQSLVKKMRVFISHTGADYALVQRLKTALLKRDFRVYNDDDCFAAGGNWAKSMKKSIKEVSEEGSVIVLLTERSMQSVYVQRELFYALRCGGRVVPVIVGDLNFTNSPLEFISNYPRFILENPNSDEELDEFVDGLKKLLKK